jgi:hypothetical protein
MGAGGVFWIAISFLKHFKDGMLPSQFTDMCGNLSVAVINTCFHYLLWVEFPPLRGFPSSNILAVPINNHR